MIHIWMNTSVKHSAMTIGNWSYDNMTLPTGSQFTTGRIFHRHGDSPPFSWGVSMAFKKCKQQLRDPFVFFPDGEGYM